MLFSKPHAPNACLQPLLEPSSHRICSLSHLITARLNSTGLGNLFADLTAGWWFQELYWLLNGPSPTLSQSGFQSGMVHTPPESKKKRLEQRLCSVALRCWQIRSGPRAVRGGGEGRGSVEMRIGRPGASNQTASSCRAPCPRLHFSQRPNPFSPRGPLIPGVQGWQKVSRDAENAKELESATVRSSRGARAPPPCSAACDGTAAGRKILNLRQPGQQAHLPDPNPASLTPTAHPINEVLSL